jgi:hypothetical protein
MNDRRPRSAGELLEGLIPRLQQRAKEEQEREAKAPPSEPEEAPKPPDSPPELPFQEVFEEPRPGEKRRIRPLSRRRRKEVERILVSREAREARRQELGVGLRPLVMCGLPLRPKKELVHQRRCGVYTVEIVGHPHYGLPYGQDRLIPIWISTAFRHLGCPADNTIRFLYARDILRAFDLPVDGLHYQRLKEGLKRVSLAQFTLRQQVVGRRGRRGEWMEHLPLLRESFLWYEERAPELDPSLVDLADPPQFLTLDAQWANEIRKHPIPVDLETVRALKTHPGALDLYQWQAWRCHGLEKTIRIPFEGETGLFAQLGCLEGQPLIAVRRRIREWQQLVKKVWPSCPNTFSRDGNALVLRPAKALGVLQRNRFLLRGLPKTPE